MFHGSFYVSQIKYFLWIGARRILVPNKFLRHEGARDLYCYMEEHVTCKKIKVDLSCGYRVMSRTKCKINKGQSKIRQGIVTVLFQWMSTQ